MSRVLRIVHAAKSVVTQIVSASASALPADLLDQLAITPVEANQIRPEALPITLDWPGLTMQDEADVLALVMPDTATFDFERARFIDKSHPYVRLPDELSVWHLELKGFSQAQLTNRYYFFEGRPNHPNPNADPNEIQQALNVFHHLQAYIDEAVRAGRGIIAAALTLHSV